MLSDGAHALIDPLAKAIELCGVVVIVAGLIVSTAIYLRQGITRGAWSAGYEAYRSNLGRGILLGLELLVAADIIATITAPLTLHSVGLLGFIVLIRTFLSFALETEIEGCWPWRRAETRGDSRHRAPPG